MDEGRQDVSHRANDGERPRFRATSSRNSYMTAMAGQAEHRKVGKRAPFAGAIAPAKGFILLRYSIGLPSRRARRSSRT
jgi:hypothetical protein